jgi:GH15 family glucan-1,4-alpha-glucosidase
MPVAFQLTTSKLLINLNYNSDLVDLCWPVKGEENLLLRSSIYEQIYLDRELQDKDYKIEIKFLPDPTRENLVNNSQPVVDFYKKNDRLETHLQVYTLTPDSFTKEYTFKNTSNETVKIDLFTIAQPDFGNNYSRDTACYFPWTKGIVHYEAQTYLGISAFSQTKALEPDEFACQAPKDFNQLGAKPDKTLHLSGNDVTTGRVESAQKHKLTLAPGEEKSISLLFFLGQNYADIKQKHLEFTSQKRITKDQTKLREPKRSELIKYVSEYIVNGAFAKINDSMNSVFAAIDSSYFKKGGVDDYSYFWPRDASLILMADLENFLQKNPSNQSNPSAKKRKLQQIKYKNLFNYIDKCFGGNLYLMHRYKLDEHASLASSWHSWLDPNGNTRFPIQLDETALVVIALGKYIRSFKDTNLSLFKRLQEITKFLLSRIDKNGVHKPCFDIWENYWGVFFATQISLIAAFKELSYIFSNYTSIPTKEIDFTTRQMIDALATHFTKDKKFIRGIVIDEKEGEYIDQRADTSLHWAWTLNVLSPTHPTLEKSINVAEKILKNKSGYARFEGDFYIKREATWFISTIYFARYFLKVRQTEKAKKTTDLILKHAESTGILPEMADPETGFGMSVRPLIWSHAEFLNLTSETYEDLEKNALFN